MPAQIFVDHLNRLADLTEEDMQIVAALPWSVVNVRRAREILSVGDRPSYVYVIKSGWAARYSIRTNGSRRITGFMLPGDFCGIHAVTNTSMEHAILALTDCEVARIQKSEIDSAVSASPAIAQALWHAKLTDEAILRMWLLNSQDAAQALAHLLCELHARAEAIGMVEHGRFAVPLTQEHIGDALGITAVHTNRMVKLLRGQGLAEITHGEVVIPDVWALRKSCGFTPGYLHLTSRSGQTAAAA